MIVDYTNRTYRITYQGVAMVENALENPNLVQISVVSGCVIMVAPQKDYGISYLPNGEYRTWNLDGMNTRLNRAEEHFIYARLNRDDNSALIVFSVNDYAVDGSTGGGEPSESYYYIKIGKITHTDKTGSDATIDREITLDFGYLDTPAAQDDTGWRELFEVTADNLIRPLKRFASFIVQGTLSIIGKLVINDKAVSDIARQGDVEPAPNNDETLPTTAYLAGKYLEELRTHFLNKDKEDQTKFLQTFLGGIVSEFMRSPDFVSGMSGAGFAVQRNADGTTYAEFDRILVRMKAVFQTLEILKTDIAGGELVLNAGAMLTVTKVETSGDIPAYFADGSEAYFLHGERAYFAQSYRLHFLADDGETRVQNLFHVGDLARCQTFGIEAGAYEGVSNRFWWRLVTAVGDDWIEVSSTVCAEGSDIPKEGDVVAQWGNDRDTDRQAVMALSAYGQGAPSITMYQGVDSFSLSGKDVFTVGYDPAKKECFLRNYGRAYVGDRDGTRYLRYSPSEGLKVVGEVEILGGSGVSNLDDAMDFSEQVNDRMAQYIGYGGWSDMVEQALRGHTLIRNGLINTELIFAQTINAMNAVIRNLVLENANVFGNIYTPMTVIREDNWEEYLDRSNDGDGTDIAWINWEKAGLNVQINYWPDLVTAPGSLGVAANVLQYPVGKEFLGCEANVLFLIRNSGRTSLGLKYLYYEPDDGKWHTMMNGFLGIGMYKLRLIDSKGISDTTPDYSWIIQSFQAIQGHLGLGKE